LKGRVLVVDDDAGVRRSIADGLGKEGFEVTGCSDGVSAMYELEGSVRAGKPLGYLVTDIVLPDVDGLKFPVAVRYRYPDLPIIVLTGYGNERIKESALSLGKVFYFEKPPDLPELVKKMNETTPGTGKISGDNGSRTSGTHSAVLTMKISKPEKSLDVYGTVRGIDGVIECYTVRGDCDVVLFVEAATGDDLDRVIGKIRSVEDSEVVSLMPVTDPGLDEDIRVFVDACLGSGSPGDVVATESSSMIFYYLDIDPEEVRKIYIRAFFTDDAVWCHAVNDGTGLVLLVKSPGTVGRKPGVIERLDDMDGVLRIREARIIDLKAD